MKKFLKWLIAIVLLSAAGYAAAQKIIFPKEKISYVTAVAAIGDVTEVVTESGTVTADDRDLYFEPSGTVAEVLVEVGDRVEAGQELMRLDRAEAEARLAAAAASRDAAQSNLDQLYAGSTAEERTIARTSVANAETALVKANQDLTDAVSTSVETVRPAFRRRAAARGRGPLAHQRPGADSGRRTDRQPRLQNQ
jgi:multidrug efflux pump subunit AcrA (membrane-fusion protein)